MSWKPPKNSAKQGWVYINALVLVLHTARTIRKNVGHVHYYHLFIICTGIVAAAIAELPSKHKRGVEAKRAKAGEGGRWAASSPIDPLLHFNLIR